MTRIVRKDMLTSLGPLNGTSNEVTLPAGLSSAVATSNYIRASARFKTLNPFTGTARYFVNFRGTSGSAPFLSLILSSTGNTIVLGVLGVFMGGIPFSVKNWYQILVEVDRINNVVSAWLNGVLVFNASYTPSQDLVTPTSITSCIGANTTSNNWFDGFIRDVHLSGASTALTQSEVDAMYQLNEYPSVANFSVNWPCDDAVYSTVAACDGNLKPVPQWNGTLDATNLFSIDTPYKQPVLDRIGGNCLSLDGNNDRLLITDTAVLARGAHILKGAQRVFAAGWAKPIAIPAANASILQLNTGTVNAGIALLLLATGQIQLVTRSRDGGTAQSVTSPTSSGTLGMLQQLLNNWHWFFGWCDFAAGIMELYVDGIIVASNYSASWEDTSYQATLLSLQVGASSGYLQGFVDDVEIGAINAPVLPQDVREQHVKGQPMNNMQFYCRYNFNDWESLLALDSSGNGIDAPFSGISTPYGFYPKSYMP